MFMTRITWWTEKSSQIKTLGKKKKIDKGQKKNCLYGNAEQSTRKCTNGEQTLY